MDTVPTDLESRTTGWFARTKRYVAGKAKKWAVDTYAFGEMITLMGFANEIIVNGMDPMQSLHARLYNLPLLTLVGPVFELRDRYRKYVWGITADTGRAREVASNFTWSMLMQATFYVPSLIAAGETDPKRLAQIVATRLVMNACLHSSISYPYLKMLREHYGTTPAFEKKTTAA